MIEASLAVYTSAATVVLFAASTEVVNARPV